MVIPQALSQMARYTGSLSYNALAGAWICTSIFRPCDGQGVRAAACGAEWIDQRSAQTTKHVEAPGGSSPATNERGRSSNHTTARTISGGLSMEAAMELSMCSKMAAEMESKCVLCGVRGGKWLGWVRGGRSRLVGSKRHLGCE